MQISQLVKDAHNVLIICHKKPDGDTLGSGFAFWNLCKAYGKNADIVTDSDIPLHYAFIPDYEQLNVQTQKNYDLAIAVDCAEPERTGKFQNYVKTITSLNVDHHKTNRYFCKYNHVVPELSSTCEAVYDIFSAEGVFKTVPDAAREKIAYCLFVGLSTDTGHFMHSNVTEKTLRAAAELAGFGINVNQIATELYRSTTMAKTRLIIRALQSIRLFRDGAIGIMTVMRKDLEDCGCTPADTEGLIDHAMNIQGVLVAVCVSEQTDTLFKVGFRSKGADVAGIAAVFGGGGHTRAAGCIVCGYYEDVIDKIVKAVSDGIAD